MCREMVRKVTVNTMARQESDHTYVKKNPSSSNMRVVPAEIDSFDESCIIARILWIFELFEQGNYYPALGEWSNSHH